MKQFILTSTFKNDGAIAMLDINYSQIATYGHPIMRGLVNSILWFQKLSVNTNIMLFKQKIRYCYVFVGIWHGFHDDDGIV